MADALTLTLEREHARGALKALRLAREAIGACESIEEAKACLDAMVDGAAIRLPALEQAALEAQEPLVAWDYDSPTTGRHAAVERRSEPVWCLIREGKVETYPDADSCDKAARAYVFGEEKGAA